MQTDSGKKSENPDGSHRERCCPIIEEGVKSYGIGKSSCC